ncbi:embryogenesis-associated protein EMB8-like [Aristolochia californica]|uniref:embryogenesis-associated protein EMB8-like n=1 Tax=Aristolochia californica TaxID=171875 RepID=UPI0035DB0B4E
MDCYGSRSSSPTELLVAAAAAIPLWYYLFASVLIFFIFLYTFLEIHFFKDLIRGFIGDRVSLTYHPASDVFHGVASLCRTLGGRYSPTPWLSSPHLQTAFLTLYGRPPVFDYQRQVLLVPDGGTIALDWLILSDGAMVSKVFSLPKEDPTPILIVIPGLTSDSSASYVKHLVFKMAKQGWKVVVCNHRGLGGMSMTSDRFYNAGWTEDLRKVVNKLHKEHPEAPLFTVGTSIGANILVKYLGEEGENTPVAGAASICSPWDLLVGDRFINRKFVQKIYDRMLTIGLQGYAQMHESILSRLANWEGIKKSRSIREFDNYATCLVGKFETVDSYYRHCSSACFVGNVAVPLLCINSLDDPLCTMEAIPWDECRTNKNIVLATTPHGGHLAFFEGMTAKSLWWVGAVGEFFNNLHSSSLMHKQKKTHISDLSSSLESSIDKGPFVDTSEDGMVAAVGNEQTIDRGTEDSCDEQANPEQKNGNALTGPYPGNQTRSIDALNKTSQPSRQTTQNDLPVGDNLIHDIVMPVRKCINKLARHNRNSMWLLAYIALVTTWPLVGSALLVRFRKKFSVFYKHHGS